MPSNILYFHPLHAQSTDTTDTTDTTTDIATDTAIDIMMMRILSSMKFCSDCHVINADAFEIPFVQPVDALVNFRNYVRFPNTTFMSRNPEVIKQCLVSVLGGQAGVSKISFYVWPLLQAAIIEHL